MYWSQLLGTRTDLTALTQAASGLAEQLHSCRTILEQPTPAETSSPEHASEARMRAARQFDQLVAQVRALPPTDALPHPEQFLAPPTLASLLPGSDNAPVAIINISQWRCDALLLTHDGVTVVALPELTEKQVIDETNRYLDALRRFEASGHTSADRLSLEMAITATLEWLWDHIANPVLTVLGHTHTPTGVWPRLWWCPTGALTVLPVHAAGYHHTRNTVLDRVVSLLHPHPANPGRRPDSARTHPAHQNPHHRAARHPKAEPAARG